MREVRSTGLKDCSSKRSNANARNGSQPTVEASAGPRLLYHDRRMTTGSAGFGPGPLQDTARLVGLDEPVTLSMQDPNARKARRHRPFRNPRLRPSFSAAGTACSYRPGRAVSSRGRLMRQNGYAANSFECCPNISTRLLVNSVMTPKNSVGDLIVASLRPNSKANCALACGYLKKLPLIRLHVCRR